MASTTPESTSPPAINLDRHEVGNGEPVLFVHGSASDQRTWAEQREPLSAQFRVITYSRRYHWPNEPLEFDGEYAMEEQLADLEAIVRSLGERVHLVGHSYGGYLALMLAIRRPELIARLVLLEPPVVPLLTGSFPPSPWSILRLLLTDPRSALPMLHFMATGLGPAAAAASKGDMETALQKFGSAVMGKRQLAALTDAQWERTRVNLNRGELLSDSVMTPLTEADVRAVTTPTLLITGKDSPAFLHRLTDRLQALLPDSERVDIAGASHIMHEDQPGVFNRAVLSFLADGGPASRD